MPSISQAKLNELNAALENAQADFRTVTNGRWGAYGLSRPSGCTCPSDCNCRSDFRPNNCGCKQHGKVA